MGFQIYSLVNHFGACSHSSIALRCYVRWITLTLTLFNRTNTIKSSNFHFKNSKTGCFHMFSPNIHLKHSLFRVFLGNKKLLPNSKKSSPWFRGVRGTNTAVSLQCATLGETAKNGSRQDVDHYSAELRTRVWGLWLVLVYWLIDFWRDFLGDFLKSLIENGYIRDLSVIGFLVLC